MKQFRELYDQFHWDEVKASIQTKTAKNVEAALTASSRTLEDFKALISPAALPYLEQMAQLSHQLTQKRFGKTIQLFAPMYLSNKCNNICTYCGFSMDNRIKRKTLTGVEILEEVKEIKRQGFNHILLVTGESNHTVDVDYFLSSIELIKPYFANISIECSHCPKRNTKDCMRPVYTLCWCIRKLTIKKTTKYTTPEVRSPISIIGWIRPTG